MFDSVMVDPGAAADGLVPVTVVGGYLGAGKTTMINGLLAGDHGQRLAVLVNDFGSVNVDAELIASHDGTTITLENGCVCCSIADSVGDALDAVLAAAPDHIVIEASGVADPGKVSVYGRGWPGCRLASVIVLADVTTIRERSDDRFVGRLVRTQLMSADVIRLTRTDLVDAPQLAAVRAWIDSDAWISDKAVADAADLFDTVVLDTPVDAERSDIEALLDSLDDSVVRVKGIVMIDGTAHVVQVTGSERTLTLAAPDTSPTGLVVIRALEGT